MTIQDIHQSASRIGKRSRLMGNAILIARVQKKSSLAPFSSRLLVQQKRRYPITFSLILKDHSAEINCQIWEGLCAQYFGKIEIGDVVSIRGFRVRVD